MEREAERRRQADIEHDRRIANMDRRSPEQKRRQREEEKRREREAESRRSANRQIYRRLKNVDAEKYYTAELRKPQQKFISNFNEMPDKIQGLAVVGLGFPEKKALSIASATYREIDKDIEAAGGFAEFAVNNLGAEITGSGMSKKLEFPRNDEIEHEYLKEKIFQAAKAIGVSRGFLKKAANLVKKGKFRQ